METMENNLPSATHQEKAKKMKKLRRWQIAISLLGVAIIVWGVIEVICLFLNYSQTETSNDAQIEQYVSPINLRASGYIDKIYFTEHQEVHKGDTLLVLDDREYKIRVMEAEAALKDAQAGATVINATLNTTQTTASVYDASIAEIEVRLAKLEKDRKRYENLVKRNAATPIQLEQIVTDYEATRKKLEATKRQKKAALSGVDEVSYRRMNTEAAIQRATAALEMARLNLSYTVVIAPCDGKLGRRSLEEGQFISAGQTITYILPDTQKWIVANYKETQIENLHIGQEVFVTVDAISDKEFKGKVTSISGATGSKYSLVPTDNSAGNFVKIQQRIPVRIDFTDLSKEDNERLAAAIQIYEALLKNGEAADVYYNLGNSYYKIGEIAKAVLNYERALLLQPGNGDIRANLEVARAKTIDKVEPVPEVFFVSWIKSLTNSMSVDAWATWGIVSFILLIIALYFFIFSKQIMLKKIGFISGIILLIVTVCSNLFASQQKEHLVNRSEAIVMNPSVTVRSTPSESGTSLFILHEGRKVSVKDNSMKEWKEIRLEDGKVGWVPASAIEVI